MTAYRQVVAQIYRVGQKASVEVRNKTGTNAFGNNTDEYVPDRTVMAFRTYPNRNTEVESGHGDRKQDRPVFCFPKDDDASPPPKEDDHLVYDGMTYDLKGETHYESHVEIFGERVPNHG